MMEGCRATARGLQDDGIGGCRAMVGGCRAMVGGCRAMVGDCRALVEVAG
jgi:hypothetical protein